MTIETMTAMAILAVRCDEPEQLFGATPEKISEIFRTLVKKWHPDHNRAKEAGAVIAHLTELKAAAEKRVVRGEWRKPGVVEFVTLDRRHYELKTLRSHKFELGEIYVGRTCIAYAIEKENTELVEAGKRAMEAIRFQTPTMRDVFEKRLPKVLASFETADRLVTVFVKQPDQVLLKDLLTFCGGKLSPTHVAWIVSDLESLACFLGLPSVGLVNPGIGPDTLLISPANHAVNLVGGWPYAVKIGEKLKAAPGRVVNHVPPTLLKAGAAEQRLTLEAIRLTACECLGHRGPVLAKRDADIPEPFSGWLIAPADKTAVQDFESWARARDASFGSRKFVELAVDLEAVYAAA